MCLFQLSIFLCIIRIFVLHILKLQIWIVLKLKSSFLRKYSLAKALPATVFDPILPDTWYIISVYFNTNSLNECLDICMIQSRPFCRESNRSKNKKKKEEETYKDQTISKIILVHSPDMLCDERIINEDKCWDLHIPPSSPLSLPPPPQLPLIFFFLAIIPQSSLFLTSSPQEGEADGGSGKIR